MPRPRRSGRRPCDERAAGLDGGPVVTRALYTIAPERQRTFRASVAAVRDSRADDVILNAWEALGIGRDVINRWHTLELFEVAEERMVLLPAVERAAVEAALLGGPA